MSKKGSLIAAFICVLILAVIFYLQSGQPASVNHVAANELRTITDLAGRKVSVKKDIRRIILLRSKDIYELAPLLGEELPDKLIAWGPDLKSDDYEAYQKFTETYPELKKISQTGSIYNDGLSVEQLVNLNPDLVIADKFIIDRGYKYLTKLEETGLPVVFLDGSNDPLTGSQRGIVLLGEILGKVQRAKEINDFVTEQFNAVLSKINALKLPLPSVYLEQGMAGPDSFGSTYGSTGNPKQYTSWGMVLHQLRVHNIADGIVAKQEPINPEYILKVDPDVIVITGQNWVSTPGSSAGAMRLGYSLTQQQAEKSLEGFTKRPGWSGLKAVKNKRLFSVFHNTAVITCFGSVQALAKYIYPQVFADLDPQQNLQVFYQRFMPITYSGTWMAALP